mgnify:CR=1 FL=1
MKTTKELAQSAKQDLRNVSPFYFINQLNRLAKKNEYCENENLQELGRRVKQLHEDKRYYFVADVFVKNSAGVFCTKTRLPKIYTLDLIEEYGDLVCTHTYKGREIVGEYYLVPVSLSLVGFIAAYKKVVCQYENEVAKVQREEKREKETATKRRKTLEKAKSVVKSVFGELADTFDNATILAKYEIIKKTK